MEPHRRSMAQQRGCRTDGMSALGSERYSLDAALRLMFAPSDSANAKDQDEPESWS
jgi:hypothetical protein